jgi:virulence factor Mce-like protein
MSATRARRARDIGIPLARLTIAAQVAAGLLLTVFLFHAAGTRLPFVDRPFMVTVVVPDAAGLDPSDHPVVTVGGVRAGKIDAVTYSASEDQARVRIALDHEVRGRLFADARVKIQPRSALQDLVLDIDPGDPAAGVLHGDVIRRADPAPIGYDRVLGVLDGDTRAYAQVLLGTLNQITDGRAGPLRDALRRLPDATDAVTVVSQRLAARRHDLSTLVTELSQILAATGRRSGELARAITQARRTLAVTDARQADLARSIGELPSTLAQAGQTFTSIHALARPLIPAVTRLRPTARALPAALRSIRSLTPTLDTTIDDLGTLVTRGGPPLRSLHRTTHELGPAARELLPIVPLAETAVRAVGENQPAVRQMLEFWPGALSSSNSLSVLTRALFLRVLPIKPGAIGLPDGTSASTATLRSATSNLRADRPDLFAKTKAGVSSALPLVLIQALVADRCLRRVDVACGLLSQLYAKPPKLLRR